MKLRLMCLVMVVVSIAVGGCQEARTPMRAQLPPTLPGWEEMYGDSDQSNLYSNVYVLIRKAREQRRINAAIVKKLELLEARDPNEAVPIIYTETIIIQQWDAAEPNQTDPNE